MATSPHLRIVRLQGLDAKLAAALTHAEETVTSHPPAALTSLRTYSEILSEHVGEWAGLSRGDDTFSGYLYKLRRARAVPRDIYEAFELLRGGGNAAAHEFEGSAREAEAALIAARGLGSVDKVDSQII